MMDTTQEIYLDNSATTRVSKEAAEKALYMMTECYGNPSSLHSKGFAAEKEMTAAREIIAERLSAQPGRFTSRPAAQRATTLRFWVRRTRKSARATRL